MTEEERAVQSAVGRAEIARLVDPAEWSERDRLLRRANELAADGRFAMATSVFRDADNATIGSLIKADAIIALRPSASTSTLIDREHAAREIERTDLVGGGVADMRAVAAAVVRNAELVPDVDPSASAGEDYARGIENAAKVAESFIGVLQAGGFTTVLPGKDIAIAIRALTESAPSGEGGTDFYSGLYAERCGDVARLSTALRIARERFAEYANLHYAKRTEDGHCKGARNDQMVALITEALGDARAPTAAAEQFAKNAKTPAPSAPAGGYGDDDAGGCDCSAGFGNQPDHAPSCPRFSAVLWEKWCKEWHRVVEVALTLAGLSPALGADEAAEALRKALFPSAPSGDGVTRSPIDGANIVYRGEVWVPMSSYREAMAGWKAANAPSGDDAGLRREVAELLALIETADEHGDEEAIVEQAAHVRAALSASPAPKSGEE